MSNEETKCCCGCGGKDERKEKLMEVINSCNGDKSPLMKVLNAAQEIYGYIPTSVQKLISEELKIPNEQQLIKLSRYTPNCIHIYIKRVAIFFEIATQHSFLWIIINT